MYLRSTIVVLLFSIIGINAEISFIPLAGRPNTVWESDSIFLGLGFVVKDPSKQIEVIWKNNRSIVSGSLYLMKPGQQDSSMFLFHNIIENYPMESSTVNIGKYPTGTPLIFKYIQEQPKYNDSTAVNKRFYSGQNRAGIDAYQSDLEGAFSFRWAIGGRIKTDTCELGFASAMSASYIENRFFVTNVYREELDKYQVAIPFSNPVSEHFFDTLSVTLSSATIKAPKIYYTLDGSVPSITSKLYNGPIIINKTTTISAFAIMPGDTQWVNSDVMTKTYIQEASSVRKISTFSLHKQGEAKLELYNIKGQKISIKNLEAIKRSHTNGVFIIKTNQTVKRLLSSE